MKDRTDEPTVHGVLALRQEGEEGEERRRKEEGQTG